ncbi:hypothetical protein F5887DRAFT_521758 [Amanita rubescens]|nr:hypothetical protein F5887DRAFT_188668 [Amanita rubescens]KAF8337865.1 hypothetical protein F5887DRAFT_521758 [Amanita rubescens]
MRLSLLFLPCRVTKKTRSLLKPTSALVRGKLSHSRSRRYLHQDTAFFLDSQALSDATILQTGARLRWCSIPSESSMTYQSKEEVCGLFRLYGPRWRRTEGSTGTYEGLRSFIQAANILDPHPAPIHDPNATSTFINFTSVPSPTQLQPIDKHQVLIGCFHSEIIRTSESNLFNRTESET